MPESSYGEAETYHSARKAHSATHLLLWYHVADGGGHEGDEGATCHSVDGGDYEHGGERLGISVQRTQR